MMVSFGLKLVLVYIIVTLFAHIEAEVLFDAPIEWLELKVQSSKFSDPNLVYIGPSKIHGRGVMAAKNLKEGKLRFLHYFEVSHLGDAEGAAEAWGMTHEQGYIPEGSDISVVGGISVKESIQQCAGNYECVGVTYRSEENQSEDTGGGLEVVPKMGISFKAKGNVVYSHDWRSYIKKERSSQLVSFPLGCSPMLLSRTEMAAAPSKELIACGARLINHSCNPTCKMVTEDMPSDFAVPGLPWTKGRVKAVYTHVLRPLKEGEELTVDYNTLHFLMGESETKQFVCEANEEL